MLRDTAGWAARVAFFADVLSGARAQLEAVAAEAQGLAGMVHGQDTALLELLRKMEAQADGLCATVDDVVEACDSECLEAWHPRRWDGRERRVVRALAG